MSRISETASFEIIPDIDGNRYRFFCQRSGMEVCQTGPYVEADAGEELHLAWEKEGRRFFSLCQSCGKWVGDVMFNADTLRCVFCSPWEEPPRFCPRCGAKVAEESRFCRSCGAKLQYGGGELR